MIKIESRSLKFNFSWTLIGNVVFAGCQWGILVVLAKLGSTSMVGQFALALAISAPVYMLLNLQLRGVQATDSMQEFKFQSYFGVRLFSSILGIAIIAIIVYVSDFGVQTSIIILIVGLTKALEAVSDIIFGLMQRHETMKKIALSMIMKGAISLVLVFVAIQITENLLWGVVAYCLSRFIVLVLYDLKNTSSFFGPGEKLLDLSSLFSRSHNGFQLYLDIIKKSLPLGIVMMLISLNNNMPRYFVERSVGEDALGIFAAMAYVIVVGTTIVGALGQSATPRLANLYASRDLIKFKGLIFKLVIFGTGIGALGIIMSAFFGREILQLLYTSDFARHNSVFVLIMIAACLAYVSSFLGYGITATRNFNAQPVLFFGVALVTVLSCYFLVAPYGITGAAIVMIVTSTTQLLGSFYVLHRSLRAVDTSRYFEKVV